MTLRGQSTTTLIMTGVLNTDTRTPSTQAGIHNSDKQFGIDYNDGNVRI